MSEKLYEFLLKLYPEHFRRAYGKEALRLVRDRARNERGFLSGIRLWLDLLLDLAISLPREYSNAPTTPITATQPLNGEPSFQLLAEQWPNPAVLFLSGLLSVVLLWVCVASVAHTRTFPVLFPTPLSLQGVVQSTLALARSPSEEASGIQNSARHAYAVPVGADGFCISARRDIPNNSAQPLFTFNFAPPGASGVALIDGRVVGIFRNEQHLPIRADVFAGNHQFVLHLDRPAGTAFMSTNDDLEYCRAN